MRLRVQEPWEPQQFSFFGFFILFYFLGLDSERAGSRTLEKSARRDRDRDCAKFESSRRFRGSNMKPKKKSHRCRGLGLDSGLDLAISRFMPSLERGAGPVVLVLPIVVLALHSLTINHSVHIYSNIPTPPSSPAL